MPNNLEARYTLHCHLEDRDSSHFLSPPGTPIFLTTFSLSTREPSLATSSSDKGSNITPNTSAGGLTEKS